MWVDFSSPFFLSTISLCSVVLAYGYLSMSVLPYSGFMAMKLVPGVNEENAGYYAGSITSSFMVGRAFASYHWGKAADLYGRTTVLYASLVLSCIFSILFGLSTSFAMALIWRFFLGLSNGMIGTVKTLIPETAQGNESLETVSVGVCMSMFGWSLLFTPVISGILADPIRQYPFLFSTTTTTNDDREQQQQEYSHLYRFLDRFPFFLPNALSSIVCLGSLLMVTGLLTETLAQKRSAMAVPHDIWRALQGNKTFNNKAFGSADTSMGEPEQTEPWLLSSSSSRTNQNRISSSNSNNNNNNKDEQHNTRDQKLISGYGSLQHREACNMENEESVIRWSMPNESVAIDDAIRASLKAFHVEDAALMSSIKYRRQLASSIVRKSAAFRRRRTSTLQQQSLLSSSMMTTTKQEEQPNFFSLSSSDVKSSGSFDAKSSRASYAALKSNTEEATISSLWAMRRVRLYLIVFWCGTFTIHTLDESLPLFLMSRQGGLGLSAISIGVVLSLSGGIFVKLQYFLYAYLVDSFGLYGSMKVGSMFMWPLIALVPFVLWLNTQGPVVDLTSNFEAALFHHRGDNKAPVDAAGAEQLTTSSSSSYKHVEGEVIAGTHFNSTTGTVEYGDLTCGALLYLTILLAVSRMLSFTFMSSLMVIMNRSVIPAHRGTMNGFCTMGGSVARAIGPSFAGLLVAFCLSSSQVVVVFPSDDGAPPWVGAVVMFLVLSGLGAVTAFLVFMFSEEEEDDNNI